MPCSEASQGARERVTALSPGADVAQGGPSPGADVAQSGPSPGADAVGAEAWREGSEYPQTVLLGANGARF